MRYQPQLHKNRDCNGRPFPPSGDTLHGFDAATPACYAVLVQCRCAHSIGLHENCGCTAPRCRCDRTGYEIITEELGVGRQELANDGYRAVRSSE
jgi:hypothetical protein